MRQLVKICGVTRPADARLAVDAGADLVGVIFAPSARQVTAGQAADIRAAAAHAGLVGVFTDTATDEIADLAAAVDLDLIQLHGSTDPEQWEAVARAAGVPVMPAVTAGQAAAAADHIAARRDIPVAALLLDLPKSGDGDAAAGRAALIDAARRCRDRDVRVVLAGALVPELVADALRRARPFGLDVCRGVEASPGVKDPDLVARFLAAADDPEVDRVP